MKNRILILGLLLLSFFATGQTATTSGNAIRKEITPKLVNGLVKQYTISKLRALRPSLNDSSTVYYSTDAGKEGVWKIKVGSSEADNLGTVLVCANWVRLERVFDYVKPEWFGAVGDGITDDAQAIRFALDVCYAKSANLILSPSVYFVGSEIQKPIVGFSVVGTKGKSTIKYSFGYACLKLTGMTNGGIEGVSFVSTHSNSTEDEGYGMLYSYWTDVKNFAIRDCYFTNANSNTSALSFYVNTQESQTNTVSNFVIEGNVFENIGRIGCTIMNKNPNKFLLENFRFNNNSAYNLGTRGSYGFLLSLDGFGQNGEVNNNYIKDAFIIGIENTGYDNFIFDSNIFTGTTTSYAPFGFSHHQTSAYIKKCIVSNNIAVGLNLMPYFKETNESLFSGNTFTSPTSSIAYTNCNNNTFANETYEGLNYGFYIESSSPRTSTLNTVSNCNFKASDNYSNIRCYGVNTQLNRFFINNLTYTGGVFFDELSGSSNNKFFRNFVNGNLTDVTETILTSKTGIKTSLPESLYLENTTSATSSTPQPSMSFTTKGSLWNMAMGAVSMKGGLQVNPVSYNVNPTVSKLSFLLGTDNATPSEVGAIDNLGILSAKGADFVGSDVKIRNTTPATSSSPIDSKKLFFEGRAWNNASGNIQNGAYLQYLNNTNNSNPVIGRFGIFTQAGVNNSGTYTERLSILSSGSIGINQTSPNGSAVLDLGGTSQGFLPPRLTTEQINAILSPANGLVVYNTNLACLCFFDGTTWKRVSHSNM